MDGSTMLRKMSSKLKGHDLTRMYMPPSTGRRHVHRQLPIASYLHCELKNTPICFWYTVYKTRLIMIKCG